MLYMVEIDLDLPTHWTPEETAEAFKPEGSRGQELIKEGKMLRAWRKTASRSTFALYEAEDHDDLHAALTSLPFHGYMQIKVTPLVEHTAMQIFKQNGGELRPI